MMLNRAVTVLITLGFLLFSQVSLAKWYHTTGVAPIKNNDIEQARSQAVADAIKQALMYSGASLSSVQTLTNGVLTQNQLVVESHGQVKHIQLVEEQQINGQLNVQVQLDILTEENQCPSAKLTNHVALTHTALLHPDQARNGQIFDIPRAYIEQLNALMAQADLHAKATPYFKQAINVASFFTQQYQYSQPLLASIGKNSNSQYILLSQISDISLGEQLNSQYAFWQKDAHQRFFNIEFILFDSLTLEKIWQKAYQTHAPWEFKKTAKVDVNSGVFWQSKYGRAITELSETLMYELNNQLRCLPTHGVIEGISNGQVIVNLGKANGLKKGQRVTLAHSNDFINYHQQRFVNRVTTLQQLEIQQVYQHSAVATTLNNAPLGNFQLNDVVTLSTQ